VFQSNAFQINAFQTGSGFDLGAVIVIVRDWFIRNRRRRRS